MAVQTVTSASNEKVKAFKSLQSAKGRAAQGLFVAEGRKLCAEAFRDACVDTLMVDIDRAGEFEDMISMAPQTLLVPAHVLSSVCEAKTPQGVAASVAHPAPMDLSAASGCILALDGVQDPGNVGTMLRTAEAAGFSGALLSPQCADAFSTKTVRATMGSIFRLPIWRGEMTQALEILRTVGFSIVTTELEGTELRRGEEIQKPFVLVIGSEGNGITAPVRAMADRRVRIPMRGRAESLNAAVAAGVLMYTLTQE